MEGLRGHTSGYAVPTFVIDAPGGGGKIPVMPNYLISYSDHKVVLRNYEGYITTYEEPPTYERHDEAACDVLPAPALRARPVRRAAACSRASGCGSSRRASASSTPAATPRRIGSRTRRSGCRSASGRSRASRARRCGSSSPGEQLRAEPPAPPHPSTAPARSPGRARASRPARPTGSCSSHSPTTRRVTVGVQDRQTRERSRGRCAWIRCWTASRPGRPPGSSTRRPPSGCARPRPPRPIATPAAPARRRRPAEPHAVGHPPRALVGRFDLRPGHRDRRDVRLPRGRVRPRGLRDVRRPHFVRYRRAIVSDPHDRHGRRGDRADCDRLVPAKGRRAQAQSRGRRLCPRGRARRGRRRGWCGRFGLRMARGRRHRCGRGDARCIWLSPDPSVAADPGGAPRQRHLVRRPVAELARIRGRSPSGPRRLRGRGRAGRTRPDRSGRRLGDLVAGPRGHLWPCRPRRGADSRRRPGGRPACVSHPAVGRTRRGHRLRDRGHAAEAPRLGIRQRRPASSSPGSPTWRSSSLPRSSSSGPSGATRARSSTRRLSR